MSHPAAEQLVRLRSAHPEWNPWLSLIEQVISAAGDRRWEDSVPARPSRVHAAPLLAHAAIALPKKLLRDWLSCLLRAAADAGTNELATLRRVQHPGVQAIDWLHAALIHNTAVLDAIARSYGVDTGAFRSVAQLLPVPLLHACRRLWSDADDESWSGSYCSLCGAWPAFAEVRGIERARYLRCGRCGRQWPAYGLRCIFCGAEDHEQLLSLMPDSAGATRSVEACKPCRGYLKSLTILHAGDPLHVLLDDLASVDLDIGAIDQGFVRPDGLGCRIDPKLSYSDRSQSYFFSWRQ